MVKFYMRLGDFLCSSSECIAVK